MGTASDWMSAAFWGIGFWGGWMMLWDAHSRRQKGIKPVLSILDILCWTLAGLSYGIVTTFHWKAFHWPLLPFTVATLVGGGVIGRLARRMVRTER